MSHFSEVKTKMKNEEVLKRTLKQLGYRVEENKEGVEVRGFMGNATRAVFKVLTDTHYDIGFVRDEEGNFQIVGDWEVLPKASGIEQEEFTNRVKREYARTSILEVAKEKGMEVECKEENGTIEMVVTQW